MFTLVLCVGPCCCRLELDTCGDLSQQTQALRRVTSLRELWLPGCTLSIEADLPVLRNLPSLVALVLDGASGWLLRGVDMWGEGVGAKLRDYCCQRCEGDQEGFEAEDRLDEYGFDQYEGEEYDLISMR